MSESTPDFSGLDAALSTASAVVENDVAEVSAATESQEVTETPSTEIEEHVDTTEAQHEQTAEEKAAAVEEVKKGTPAAKIRAALKAFKEADPEGHRAYANELNNLVGRSEEITKLFPGGVKEIREFKTFTDAIGGVKGITQMQGIADSALESDQLLYSGDGKLIDNIIADLKAENKLDALGKIAVPFLDKLMQNDPAGYEKAFTPHFASGLQEHGVDKGLNHLVQQYNYIESKFAAGTATAKDLEGLKRGLTDFANWYNGLQKNATESKRAPQLAPEHQALLDEKKAAEKNQTTTFQTELNAESMKNDTSEVIKAMTPFMKLAFFKDFPKESRTQLCHDVYTELRTRLKADKDVQEQMSLLWKGKDKGKILGYWNTRVQSLVAQTAKDVIKLRYPGAWKSAPKVQAKTEAAVKVASNTKPVPIAAKPKWEEINWDLDPKQTSYIMGRAHLKNGRYVTWAHVK